MDRRSFVLGGLAALVALSTPNVVDKGVEIVARASAEEFPVYEDIGKYYDDGTPSDVMPGARRCSKARLEAEGLGFQGKEWYELYFDNPQYNAQLQSLFKGLDGQRVQIHSSEHEGETIVFDFNEFNSFNKQFREQGKTVNLWNDGFMSFGDKITYERIVIPIPYIIIQEIRKL